jgi:endoglucanase
MGVELDSTWAKNPKNYSITSIDDPAFATGISPTIIWRKIRPFRRANLPNSGWGLYKYTHCYEIYLNLPKSILPNKTYTINFASIAGNLGTQLSKYTFSFNDKTTKTEAIQVNQHGYQIESPKIAFLSSWIGDGNGLNYSEISAFNVLNESGGIVFSGIPTLRNKNGEPEFYIYSVSLGGQKPISNSKAYVYALDFSSFKSPGKYTISIPGLGVSMPFTISSNIWGNAFKVSMKGYYHQRAGIELGLPYSNYSRPRDFNPADGVKTYTCNDSLFYNSTTTDIFSRIQNSIQLTSTVNNAIGGWHDAADFDRDIYSQHHLFPVNMMIDLYLMNPSYFESLNLNIPESTNSIPDLLDEALWCTDLFLKIQRPDGGVPSAIESIEHPKAGETGWLNTLPTALTPPSLEANYDFAAVAARLSLILRKYDAAKALAYYNAAINAMNWIDLHQTTPVIYLTNSVYLNSVKNLAYASLYNLTGDIKWETLFSNTMPTTINRIDRELGGLFVYLTSSNAKNAALITKSKNVIITYANKLIVRQDLSATYTSIEDFYLDTYSHRFTPFGLAYAGYLSRDMKYIDGMAKSAHYMLGANPMNISYTKGLGNRQVRPRHKDATNRGLDVPDGIEVFGSLTNKQAVADSSTLITTGIYPSILNWPGTESYFDDISPAMNEFTVVTMSNSMFGFGSLAILCNNLNPPIADTISQSSEKKNSLTFTIYPNPVSNSVIININGTVYSNTKMNLIDLTGKLITSRKITENQTVISVSDLQNGVYLIELVSNMYTERCKLIVRK